jgi:hypothetical protein
MPLSKAAFVPKYAASVSGSKIEASALMATARSKKKHSPIHHHAAPRLKSITGGKAASKKSSAVEDLFSGRVTTRPKNSRIKEEAPPIELRKGLQKYADVFAAGRALEREIKMKADFARQQVEEFCLADIAKQYATINRRPSSRNFISKHSRFRFVFTERTTLTPEKSEELSDMNIPLEEHTEVRGVRINYDTIRQHKLEEKLRDALESLKVSKGVLDEIFTPEVHLKESFYNVLTEIVRNSLKEGEKLEDKILNVIQVLSPATQIRNVETIGLNPKQTFELVKNTQIEASQVYDDEDEVA